MPMPPLALGPRGRWLRGVVVVTLPSCREKTQILITDSDGISDLK